MVGSQAGAGKMMAETEQVGRKGGLLKTIGGCVSAFGCLFGLIGLLVLGLRIES